MTTRHSYLAEIVNDRYPKNIRIADIGSGYPAELQEELRILGFENVVSFDKFTKEEILPENTEGLVYINKYLTEKEERKFDLVLSIHSCGATKEIVKYCNKNKTSFIIILCGCAKFPYKSRKKNIISSFIYWCNLLKINTSTKNIPDNVFSFSSKIIFGVF